jgi:hypothetical protein
MDNPKHPLLNAPIFHTELFLPKYKSLQKNNWRITHMGLGFDHGYFTDVWVVENMPILSRRSKDDEEKWESWMSICPHELESQELSCKYAHGKVVIMGLGMGWVAINVAFNPQVEKVIVVEIDEEVIEIFRESGALTDVPQEIQDKITIVNADALNWKPDKEKIDFLYIDIWKNLVEPQAIEDIRRMQKNINAEKIYFWGQELFFFKELHDAGLTEGNMTKPFLTNVIEKMNLPLLLPEDINYPSMVIQAGRQRIKRKLPLSK